MNPDLTGLPGEEMIRQGLADLMSGEESVPALLIQIGASRMREAGLPVPQLPPPATSAELRLYSLLCLQHGANAYSQYNALLRRLISFEQALECRRSAFLKKRGVEAVLPARRKAATVAPAP